jgi:hypothetical protein
MFKPEKPFTVKDGLKFQAEHVSLWETLLNAETIARLHAERDRRNAEGNCYRNGYDVWRGCEIDAFIHNIGYENLRLKAKT